jgi:hypothetical protein
LQNTAWGCVSKQIFLIASPNQDGLSGSLCIAIAKKLMQDADFQAELMRMVDEEE